MTKPSPDPSNISGSPKVGPKGIEGEKIIKPDESAFKSEMQQAPGKTSDATSQVSPMDLASKSGVQITPTFQSLLGQVQNTKDTLGEVEKNLKTPQLKLKKSQQQLLKNKLTDANSHLQTASEKLGANPPPDTLVDKNADPVARFLGMITDGQNKLQASKDQLEKLSKSGQPINPGDMLLIQVKLNQAQQEIDYSSILLSKVVDVLKQMLNIQL